MECFLTVVLYFAIGVWIFCAALGALVLVLFVSQYFGVEDAIGYIITLDWVGLKASRKSSKFESWARANGIWGYCTGGYYNDIKGAILANREVHIACMRGGLDVTISDPLKQFPSPQLKAKLLLLLK